MSEESRLSCFLYSPRLVCKYLINISCKHILLGASGINLKTGLFTNIETIKVDIYKQPEDFLKKKSLLVINYGETHALATGSVLPRNSPPTEFTHVTSLPLECSRLGTLGFDLFRHLWAALRAAVSTQSVPTNCLLDGY